MNWSERADVEKPTARLVGGPCLQGHARSADFVNAKAGNVVLPSKSLPRSLTFRSIGSIACSGMRRCTTTILHDDNANISKHPTRRLAFFVLDDTGEQGAAKHREHYSLARLRVERHVHTRDVPIASGAGAAVCRRKTLPADKVRPRGRLVARSSVEAVRTTRRVASLKGIGLRVGMHAYSSVQATTLLFEAA